LLSQSDNSKADPYTAKASQDATPEEKIQEVQDIISTVQTAMLVSQHPDGNLHGRAVMPLPN